MELSEYFSNLSKKLLELNEEIRGMTNQKKENKNNKEFKKRVVSSRTVEPMTRLRKNVEEAKYADENPDIQFINDRLNDILKE